jgi:S1-C subfamily serine protease
MIHDPSLPDPSLADSSLAEVSIAPEQIQPEVPPFALGASPGDHVDRWRPGGTAPTPPPVPSVPSVLADAYLEQLGAPAPIQAAIQAPVVLSDPPPSPWSRPGDTLPINPPPTFSAPTPTPPTFEAPAFQPPAGFTPSAGFNAGPLPGPVQGPVQGPLQGSTQGRNPVSSKPVKQAWAKPALVGGLIGALLSGAASTAAIVATRDDRSTVAAPTAAAPSAATPPAATPAVKASAPIAVPGSGATSNSIKAAYEAVAPAVVSISTLGFESGNFSLEPSEGAGSGIVVSSDGLVLTNSHVVTGSASIKVTFSDRTVKTATLVGRSRSNDVALIKVQDVSGLATATLGDSDALEVGDPVVAVGNALALEGGPTVTSGIISALDRDISDQDVSLSGLIQTDSAINPGNSGGPLVNMAGEVVGMNTAIIQNSNNIGFAIAMKEIKPLIEDLQNGGGDSTKPRTFIGVTTQTVDATVQQQFDLAVDSGAIVVDISAGSPAENAGILPGDVIVKFDGKPVPTNEDLGRLVRAKKPKDQVVIEWRRGQERRTATVVLGQTTALG